ncbi:hypothetical protein V3G39_17860 (plasmid) [Dermatophilaceae bacterium Sec6.4]
MATKKTHHVWPICISTGKARYGERKDTKLALSEAARLRSVAERNGALCTWTVLRAYRCDECYGWHLTSKPQSRGWAA